MTGQTQPKFGTSGLRGLVVDLTETLVAEYTRAFVAACETGSAVYVGRDLRPSSPEIVGFAIEAARKAGKDVVDCGALPTPALAHVSTAAGASAVMVTGSHIPADRNGLKFYTPTGEISKSDEEAIVAALGQNTTAEAGNLRQNDDAAQVFVARYTQAFGADALSGLRIGVYQHSSVARDQFVDILEGLGAETVALARSDVFIPVDTEAVDVETRNMLADWCATHKLDAVVSTDGDADRPMLTDHTGQVVPGDVLGVMTAKHLGATEICTPVSSNSMVTQLSEIDHVSLTRIGSPFVIAAMEARLAVNADAQVVGYEANGGFLLGFDAQTDCGMLSPLLTRDSVLPAITPLIAARAAGQTLAQAAAALPPVFTAADRLQGIPTEASKAYLAELTESADARAALIEDAGTEARIDLTDGLRIELVTGEIVHLRPSGNAPEFRCYAEARSPEAAEALVKTHLEKIKNVLGA